MEKNRLFVGNLPPNISETDIKKKFKKFGNVTSVEIKQRQTGATFAFVDLEASADSLNSCFSSALGKTWDGHTIKLEVAKESFLSKLEKERKEKRTSAIQNNLVQITENKASVKREAEQSRHENKNKRKNDSSPSGPEVEPKRKLKKLQGTNKVLSDLKKLNVGDVQKESSDDSSDDSSSSDSEVEPKWKLKKFQGTKTCLSDLKNQNVGDVQNAESHSSFKEYESTDMVQRLESFSDLWKDPPLTYEPVNSDRIVKSSKSDRSPVKSSKRSLNDSSKLLLAEEKRKKALDEKRKSFNMQKEAIKKALTSVDSGHQNKKIVFDEDKDETSEQSDEKDSFLQSAAVGEEKKVKKTLFSGSSDEEEEDGTHDIRIKSQFEGNKGQKLLALQSHYANDRRFTLDERFYESDDDMEQVDNIDTIGDDEKKRQLEILQNVLGHQISMSEKKKHLSMLRFDPTKPDHAKFEKKVEPKVKTKLGEPIEDDETEMEVVPTMKDSDETKINEISSENNKEVLVSKEKFYKVEDSLKQSLQNKEEQSGFSLRKLFSSTAQDSDSGGDDDNNNKSEEYNAKNIKKQKQIGWNSNPFKYDSSDSEGEEEHSKPLKHTEVQSGDSKQASVQLGGSFFFRENDPRFQEGLDFFKPREIQDPEEFAIRRRELKRLIRTKVKNNERNHCPIRKKLGGNKSRKFNRKF